MTTDPSTRDELAELLEAWRANQRINVYLIERIPEEAMSCTLSTRGGRGVAGQFAHLHNVRFWHLEQRAKDLVSGLRKFETKVEPSKAELLEALEASGRAVETFFTDLLAGVPKRRGFKRGVYTHLAYFISHESHHRGNILLTLKQSGHNLSQAERYAIWNWDRI